MAKQHFWQVIIIVFLPIILFAQGERWIYRYNETFGNDEARSIVYGADGNIYAAGRSEHPGTIYDFTVISLTSAGDTNWVYIYNRPTDTLGMVYSLAYGADDNIYAVGRTRGIGTNYDFTVISLNSSGYANWIYLYNGPGNSYDCANSVVYGADGNIYAAGSSGGISSNDDFTVISLTPAGDTNWIYRYIGPGNSGDCANSVVYGTDGNIYAAGYSGGNGDFTVISLTPAGSTNWVYQYNGSGNSFDCAYSIAYGADGNIYAAGSSRGNSTYYDFTVISLTPAGDTNWIYRYNGPGNIINDEACDVVFGADGNIYTAGYSGPSGGNINLIVISLTPACSTNWIYQYNGPGNWYDYARDISYGADGIIYVAGYTYSSSTATDFLVISLTTAGGTNWEYLFNGSGNYNDNANSVVYGADGNIYAAGYSVGTSVDHGTDFIVISLPRDMGVKENNYVSKKSYSCATILGNAIQLSKGKSCRVFDITGRVVEPTLIKPGIYFIEVDGKVTQKVIKIR